MRSKKPAKSGSTAKHRRKRFRQGPYLKSQSALVPPDTSRIPWMSKASTTRKAPKGK